MGYFHVLTLDKRFGQLPANTAMNFASLTASVYITIGRVAVVCKLRALPFCWNWPARPVSSEMEFICLKDGFILAH